MKICVKGTELVLYIYIYIRSKPNVYPLSARVSSDLQLKAAEVNKTLSRNDGSPDKSLKEMKEDVQEMLAEMRKRQLAGQKSAAEDELRYGHAQTNPKAPRRSSQTSVKVPTQTAEALSLRHRASRVLPQVLPPSHRAPLVPPAPP